MTVWQKNTKSEVGGEGIQLFIRQNGPCANHDNYRTWCIPDQAGSGYHQCDEYEFCSNWEHNGDADHSVFKMPYPQDQGHNMWKVEMYSKYSCGGGSSHESSPGMYLLAPPPISMTSVQPLHAPFGFSFAIPAAEQRWSYAVYTLSEPYYFRHFDNPAVDEHGRITLDLSDLQTVQQVISAKIYIATLTGPTVQQVTNCDNGQRGQAADLSCDDSPKPVSAFSYYGGQYQTLKCAPDGNFYAMLYPGATYQYIYSTDTPRKTIVADTGYRKKIPCEGVQTRGFYFAFGNELETNPFTELKVYSPHSPSFIPQFYNATLGSWVNSTQNKFTSTGSLFAKQDRFVITSQGLLAELTNTSTTDDSSTSTGGNYTAYVLPPNANLELG